MYRLVLFLLSVAFSSVACANVDLLAPGTTTIRGDEVTIKATVESVPVMCVAKINRQGISAISFEIEGQTIVVPNAEFRDLSNPQIESVQLLYGGDKGSQKPLIFLKLNFGPVKLNGNEPEFNQATFHFTNGQYTERWTRELVGPDRWQHRRKPVGKPDQPAGTESVLR